MFSFLHFALSLTPTPWNHTMLPPDLKSQFDSLLPGNTSEAGATRRTALKVALGMGYAAAALPVWANAAITTSTDGLRTGQAVLESAGASVPFYYAAPQGKTNLPVILVVQEIFGVHAYIADTCRRFAHAGYLAIAPELHARYGNADDYTEVSKLVAELVSKVPDAEVMADLDAALAWAGKNGGNTAKAGITGFCWGGRITWLYAAHNPSVKAGVAWYGRLVGKPSALTPKHPQELAASLQAPVLGLYGGQDTGIPLTTVNAMKDTLAAAGAQGNRFARDSEFVVYPDAGHAFHADCRPSYRKEAAEDGFQRALAWFKDKGLV
jgi:carboxymethylenebutenolidase